MFTKTNTYRNGQQATADQKKSADQRRHEREERIRGLLDDEDELLGKAYDSRLVRRLLHSVDPYRRQLITAILLMIVSSLMSVAAPTIIGRAIDDGIRANDFTTLRFWTVLFIITALVEWVTNRQRISIMGYVGTQVVADYRSQLFRHLHSLSLNFHNNYSVGRLSPVSKK